MGDFKLKRGVSVTYNANYKSYTFTGVDASKMNKLTSRAFACMLGHNVYESAGKSILERFKLIETEDIDEYWGIRGDMAELLVLDFLKDAYNQQGIELDLKTWDKEQVSYDNFRKNEKFGGLLDIAIAHPEEYRAVVEVKSKSLKDLDKITATRGRPEEVQQGLFLTKLSNVTKCLMAYVFFTPDQEATIKDYITEKNVNKQHYPSRNFAEMLIAKMGLTPKSCKISIFKHTIDAPTKFENDMETAYQKLIDFGNTCSINASEFRVSETDYLDDLSGNGNLGLF